MGKPVLFYIHGFMSSGSTLKGQALKRRYQGRFDVRLPTYPQQTPQQSMTFLQNALDDAVNGVLVGSSLGGFYAQYLAYRLGWPVVMINPVLDLKCVPISLEGRHKNPYTGEQVEVSQGWIEELSMYQSPPVKPSLLLLCADDNTVLPDCALDQYRGVGHIYLLPDGGHACWPMMHVWPVLDDFLAKSLETLA
jgi:predicted esterase YcpF (UPF0227 family)